MFSHCSAWETRATAETPGHEQSRRDAASFSGKCFFRLLKQTSYWLWFCYYRDWLHWSWSLHSGPSIHQLCDSGLSHSDRCLLCLLYIRYHLVAKQWIQTQTSLSSGQTRGIPLIEMRLWDLITRFPLWTYHYSLLTRTLSRESDKLSFMKMWYYIYLYIWSLSPLPGTEPLKPLNFSERGSF